MDLAEHEEERNIRFTLTNYNVSLGSPPFISPETTLSIKNNDEVLLTFYIPKIGATISAQLPFTEINSHLNINLIKPEKDDFIGDILKGSITTNITQDINLILLRTLTSLERGRGGRHWSVDCLHNDEFKKRYLHLPEKYPVSKRRPISLKIYENNAL